jgi:hypothetical protein
MFSQVFGLEQSGRTAGYLQQAPVIFTMAMKSNSAMDICLSSPFFASFSPQT